MLAKGDVNLEEQPLALVSSFFLRSWKPDPFDQLRGTSCNWQVPSGQRSEFPLGRVPPPSA